MDVMSGLGITALTDRRHNSNTQHTASLLPRQVAPHLKTPLETSQEPLRYLLGLQIGRGRSTRGICKRFDKWWERCVVTFVELPIGPAPCDTCTTFSINSSEC
jgi:hypothetical protein